VSVQQRKLDPLGLSERAKTRRSSAWARRLVTDVAHGEILSLLTPEPCK